MNLTLNKCVSSALMLATAGIIAGCASSGVQNPSGVPVTQMRADDRGFVAGTGVESQDMVVVTDKMARGILAVPQIANAQGTPCIVFDPVKNNTRFAINKDLFLTRIRSQINEKAPGKITFLARDRMEALEHERELKQSGQVTASANPNQVEFRGADFYLTGVLDGMSTRTGAGTSDYVHYDFQLIDARTSAIVWEQDDEIKKQGLEDAAYR
jgi:penicillin-binding protein activator